MVGQPVEAGVARRRGAAAQVLVDDPGAPVLSAGDAHHLGRVLRLRPGEAVVATDGAGRWAWCRYDLVAGRPALEVDGPLVSEAAPAPAVTVAFAPVKGDRPDLVVQKLTELGVDRIVPLSAARSVVRWEGARAGSSLTRLRKVAAEACSQSRRVWLPEVGPVRTLSQLVEESGPAALVLAEPGGPPLAASANSVAVGPEGGWSPDELGLGCPTAGLSPYVLRAETAAVAAGVLLCADRAPRTGTVEARSEGLMGER